MGVVAAVWVARIPAIKGRLALSDGRLGLALLATPVGLILATMIAGRLVDRFGSGRMTRVSGTLYCLLLVTPGLAGNLAELMAALLATGVAGGTMDVSMNAHGVRVENAYGRPVMASLHACYSLGGFGGALFGAAFAWASLGPEPTFLAAGIPAAAVGLVAGRWLGGVPALGPAEAVPHDPSSAAGLSHDLPPDSQLGAPAQSGAPAEPAPAALDAPGQRLATPGRFSPRRTAWLVLALGVVGLCALVSEGAAGDWSAVYLHDNLGASAGLAAIGFGVFSVTMTLGRMAGDRLVARFGRVRLVRACGLIGAVGLAGGLLSHSVAGGLAGFAVLGAGLSCIVPQVFSAGGRADPARPGRGLARVVGLSYLGLAGGPVVIGACASLTGLPLALGIPVVLSLWIAISASALASGSPDPT